MWEASRRTGSRGLLVLREETPAPPNPSTFQVRKLRLREVESLLQGCLAPERLKQV